MINELPNIEKLVKRSGHFKCHDCDQVIGMKEVKAEGEKADHVTDYYRIKKVDPISFIFVCPGCVRGYEES